MHETEPLSQPKKQRSGRVKVGEIFVALGFLALYTVDVSIRATRKAFWFDELFTYYVCRLPTLHDSWQAVLHGVDLNPPLFYILTRLSLHSIEGPVGARLPEMVGFAVLCLALFRFVSVRAGFVAGTVAMIFPVVTGAMFYAYEGRPHGLVLGFCGIAIVCWQMTREHTGKILWNACFAAALAGAFMTHCYAILIGFPFVVAELVISLRSRRIRWATWAAMAIPGVAGALITLRLFMVYKNLNGDTNFNALFAANFSTLGGFYIQLLGHFITAAILLSPFLIYRFGSARRSPNHYRNDLQTHAPSLPADELALAVGFVILPGLGLLVAKVMHGPYLGRYFLASVIGFSILLAYALPSGSEWADNGIARFGWRRNSPALILIIIMLGVAVRDLRRTISPSGNRGLESEVLIEPSSSTAISMAPGKPLTAEELIDSNLPPAVPLAVVDPLGFLPLTYYRPDLASRLFHVSWTLDDSAFPLERNLREWCHVDIHDPISSLNFLRTHGEFMVYGRPGDLNQLAKFIQAGARVRQLNVDEYHFLALLEVSAPASITR